MKKKLLSVFMSLAMIFSFVMPASAANDHGDLGFSIVANNTKISVTYDSGNSSIKKGYFEILVGKTTVATSATVDFEKGCGKTQFKLTYALAAQIANGYCVRMTEIKNGNGNIIVKYSHGQNKSTVTVAPTCEKEGLKTITCDCGHGESVTEVIPALGHKFAAVNTVLPTCEVQGYTVYKCSNENCGKTYNGDYVEKLGHLAAADYTEIENVAPTCVTDGKIVTQCLRNGECTHTITKTISALGHLDVSEYTEIENIEPTYDTNGRIVKQCLRDGECTHTITEIIPALGHTALEPVIVAPTCETPGSKTINCDCGEELSVEVLKALGHNWNDGEVTIEATCTSEGEITYTCQRDSSHTKTETIAKIAHHYETTTTNPTCTVDGSIVEACTVCGDKRADDVVLPKLGHEFVETENVPATCEQDGYITETCVRSDATRTTVIPATGHNYESVVTPPTYDEEGYTTHTCTECGDTYIDSYVPKLVRDNDNDNENEVNFTDPVIPLNNLPVDYTANTEPDDPNPALNYVRPVANTPVAPESDITFDDPEIPLAEIPEVEEIADDVEENSADDIDFDEAPIPLAILPEEEEKEEDVDFDDSPVPLGDTPADVSNPKTGTTAMIPVSSSLLIVSLAAMFLSNKKKKDLLSETDNK